MNKLIISALCLTGLTACSESNISISIYEKHEPILGIRYEEIWIKALEDEVTINGVVGNRGGCRMQNKSYPHKLAFGEVFILGAYECDVLELEVTTNTGDWTETYDGYK